jgi:transposase
MSEALISLPEMEGAGPESLVDIRKPHVRRKRIFRRAIDPAFEMFDYALEIPEDHLVRKLRAGLCSMDLSYLEEMYPDYGGVGYDPEDVLGPMLLGMKEGVRSGEALERACLYDVRYRFLAGGHRPDRRTFQRVRERFSSELNALHGSVLKRARRLKKVSGAEVAVDGTKVAGNSSAWTFKQTGSRSDPDVRSMDSHGRKCQGYNVQFAVDTMGPAKLILGCEVLQDQNDLHAMPKVMDALEEQFGERPAQVVADTGYETAQTIQDLEGRGIESLICPAENLNSCLKENADGELVCPAGKLMVFMKTRSTNEAKAKSVRVYDVYRPQGGCAGCPLRPNCALAGQELKVPTGTDPGARFRNRQRIQSDAGSGAMIRRRLAELPFAMLKRHTRFDRFLTRGLTNVRAEMLLWVISYNLFKLLDDLQWLFRLILAIWAEKSVPASAHLPTRAATTG